MSLGGSYRGLRPRLLTTAPPAPIPTTEFGRGTFDAVTHHRPPILIVAPLAPIPTTEFERDNVGADTELRLDFHLAIRAVDNLRVWV